jgi:Fic family protein
MSDLEMLRREYPHLQFRKHWEITPNIAYLLGQCEAIVRAICDTPLEPGYHQHLKMVSLRKGAQATTAIEGNTLSEDEIAKVAAGQSLPPSKEYQEIEVRNILAAMNSLADEVIEAHHTEAIAPELLQRFHELIGKNLGEHFKAVPGKFATAYRTVGPYRCPRPEHIVSLVTEFCGFLAREFDYVGGNQSFIDAVIEAIVAHVYLEWIHPFDDGNGRTGRLLECYILLRAGTPDIASHIMSNHYNDTRLEYYRHLDKSAKERDLTGFLAYALVGFRDGLENVLATVQSNQFDTAWKSYIYDQFANKKYHKQDAFKRKRDLILNMPIEKPMTLDQLALITPDLARAYAKVTERTLIRDLHDLEEMGLVKKTSDYYVTNHAILKLNMARRLNVRKPNEIR